ncbi:AAA family ATPase [Candidatus Woesearchaeota archaeon]|nr:AAA family ATPase [Candidatus Woesearchaeota archaeon]
MTKFIALASGKGGVGKTTTTISLGYALEKLGKDVLIVDGNLVTPNVATHLGMPNPQATLNKFLRKEKGLKDIIHTHESGLRIIPASPSFAEFQKTNVGQLNKLFFALDNVADIILIDAPSGLGYDVEQIFKNSDEVLVIVNPTLPSVMDALKTMQLAQAHNNTIAGVILNMTHNDRHELKQQQVEEILGQKVIARISFHKKVRRALHKGMPLAALFPRCKPSREFNTAAKYLTFESESTL